jgi:tetratricopeptide (TPR) repeat protein
VRELANTMERAALLSEDYEITAAMLDLHAGPAARAPAVKTPSVPASLDDALRAHVEAGLRASGGNIRQAAAALGISRNTLRARMDKYGLRHRETESVPPPQPASVVEGEAPADWERRHLAVLCARLLPSPTVDLTRALMEIGEKVRSFGGQIEESGPTGLIAVFGLEAVDNAPSHAALAALAIQGAAAHTSSAPGGQVEAVVAIHCDHRLVRREGAHFDIAADGKAALWSALEDLVAVTRPGHTAVSAAVVPFLTRRFALAGPREPRGEAWMLLRLEDGPAPSTPFVGRPSETALLLQSGARAERGHGQVVGVAGEAGVGKTRLLREVVRQLHGWRVVSGGGAPYSTNTPYAPLMQLLRSFCGIQDADGADAVREKVVRSLPPGAAQPEWLVPALLDLLGALPPDDAFRAVEPAMRRQRMHDGLRQVFVAASAVHPLCLVIEDLQWADSATQEVLDRLVNGIAAARVLLLVNYRPEYQHPWGLKSHHTQIRLDALPPDSAGEMLDALVGVDPGLATLKQSLARRGNPLFLEETIRTLVETKALEGRAGSYRLTRPVHSLEVPPTVQAILAARIDRLAPENRRLLQIAAVIGKDVPLALLQAIADRPEESLRRGLEALQAAAFLVETGLHPDLGYSFTHALTHEGTYGTLLEDRRKALHARILVAIERLHADRLNEHVGRLARHAVRGEMWQQAATYSRQAGAEALARCANREAVAHFEQALAALQHLPETRATQLAAIDLRFDLRTALFPLGEFERIVGCLREAEGLARTLGDHARLGQLSMYMCHNLFITGHPTEALVFGQSAQALAAAHGDVPLKVTANLYLGVASFSVGDYRKGEELLGHVLRLLEGNLSGARLGLAGFPAVLAPGFLAQLFTEQGDFRRATVHGQDALRIAEALDHPYSLAFVRFVLAYLHTTRGDLGQATIQLERGLALSNEWNLSYFSLVFNGILGYVHALSGRTAEGIPLLEHSLSASEAMGHATIRPLFLAYLGEAYLLADRLDDAREFAARALALARERGMRPYEASALRFLAEVSAHSDSPDHAEGYYRDALTLAAELAMQPLVAHCHLGLGTLYRRTGQDEKARGHLDNAMAMYRGMEMRLWLEQAQTALADLP